MLDLLWFDGPAAVLARPASGVGGGGAVVCGAGGPAPDPGDPDESWVRAVALGACGRYAEAAALLGRAADSRSASTRASHLRQVGRHAEAAPLDERALVLAAGPADRADAAAGLVADALGAGDAGRAHALLDAAVAAAGVDGGWRSRTRLCWVRAELALLDGDPEAAAADADAAVAAATAAGAPRHLTKSLLVRGVARHTLSAGPGIGSPLGTGSPDGAAADLLAALERATATGLLSLVWPAAAVAAQALPSRAPQLLAVAGAAAARVVAGLGPDGPAFAARPDVAALLAAAR